jgi:MFS transporter, OCT family, solute carrier family 22 (organic cation transporter), member 4/5
MHFAGIVVGSGIFGFLADVYGRKKIFITAIIVMSLTGIGQALSNNYITFISFAFLNAIGTSGVYPLAFVIGVEMVGKKKREMAGVVLNYFYSVGEALVGVIAWLDADWVNIQLWVSAPPLIFFTYYWLIPESIRWLIAKKRKSKALKIIVKAAKNNGVVLSHETLNQFQEYDDDVNEDRKVLNEKLDEHASRPVEYRDLIRSKILLTRCTILFFIW